MFICLIISVILNIYLFIIYRNKKNKYNKKLKELSLSKEEAIRANNSKTEFLSSMSHEIRTPLNAIVGFSKLINNEETLEDAKEDAKDIVTASNTLLEIVNGVLDISKIESGKVEIVESPYNTKETFDELAVLMKSKIEEKGIKFSYYITPDIPPILNGDYINIKKIITNLLSNAYKYTETGYIKYEVNCINHKDKTKLIISVEDSGVGIDNKDVDRLFDKFERVSNDNIRLIEGTGLGLAITKQLVELMNGRITVKSTLGVGSKFIVVIDQRRENTLSLEENKKIRKLNLDNIKILLVDDNELNLKLEKRLLEEYQCNNIECVCSGYECIEKVKENKYDLILLDIMMPKLSGEETLLELRKLDGFKTPVIALTANAITGTKERYLTLGFSDYLSKPIELEELKRVLNKIIKNIKINKKNTRDKSNIKIKKYLINNGVDIKSSLKYLKNMKLYNTTLDDYLENIDNKVNKLKEYKTKCNMKDYAILAHSMKSDSKYLGLTKFSDILYKHEKAGKDNNIDYVNNHFNELKDEYNKIISILKTYKNMR